MTYEKFDKLEDGNVVKIENIISFPYIPSNRESKFMNKYEFDDFEDKLVRTKHLVLSMALKGENIELEINQAIDELNSYLQLTSLISRSFSFYHKYKLLYKNYQNCTYRGFFSYPQKDYAKGYSTIGVILPKFFHKFLEESFNKFILLNKIKNISYPIYYLTNAGKDISVESKYLLYFAGLETLLDLHKKDKKLEGCLTSSKFKKFRKHIKSCIYDYDKINETQKEYIVEKIPELNRISLSKVYDSFCSTYNIKDSDLWPVFIGSSDLSLSKIRNKLIHGATIPSNYVKYMSLATYNLRILLERCYLGLLNWDLSKSCIHYAHRNADILDEYISKFSDLFNETGF